MNNHSTRFQPVPWRYDMTDPRPIPVDYARPEDQSAAKTITSLGLMVVLAIPYLFIALLAWVVVPRFEQVFRDFKMALPLITEVFLGFCKWFRSGFGWAILLLVVFGLPVVMVQWNPRGSRRTYVRGAALLVLVLLFYGAVSMAAVLALGAPLMKLMDDMSKP